MPIANISVVIPFHNSAPTILTALDSVLQQTLAAIEIIFVDDGSSDNSLDLITSYSLKYPQIIVHSQKNSGPAIARNKGVDIANGEWIAFLDADDYWYPCHLDNLYSILKQHPDLRWASAAFDKEINSSVITECVRLPNKVTDVLESYLASVRHGHAVNTNTVLIHRETFLELGGFRFDWHVSEDSNLWYRFGIHYPCLGYSTTPSSRYCHNTESISMTARKGNKVIEFKIRSLDAAIAYARDKDVLDREDVGIYLTNHLNVILKTALNASRQEMLAILKKYREMIPHFSLHWKTLAYLGLSFIPGCSPYRIAQSIKTNIRRQISTY